MNPKKILVVDDEPLFVSSIVETLIRANFEFVESAKDGREALEKIEQTQFDLIITDINMPGIGGVEFLTALAKIPYRGPIFVLSAFLNPETERLVRQRGVTAFFDKPIDLKSFVRLVNETLKRPDSMIDGLTIGLAQTLEQEGKTCLLRVFSRGDQGDLAFSGGVLVDAVTEHEQGDRAAVDIFTWDATKVEIHKATEERYHRVTQSLTHLVLEALAVEDEVKKNGGRAPVEKKREHRAPVEKKREDRAPIAEKREDREPIAEKKVIPIPQIHKSITEEKEVSNYEKSLLDLMQVDGSIAASIVDLNSGTPLGMIGGGKHFNLEAASAGNTKVVRSKLAVIKTLNLGTNIEDILITLGTQFHLIRPITKAKTLFLYFVLDRDKANLAMARHKLGQIEKDLTL